MELKISIYDLGFYVLKKVSKEIKPTNEMKKQVLLDFANLLDNGWAVCDIVPILKRSKINIVKVKDKDFIDIMGMFNCCNKTSDNLLIPTKKYYHNELRISPKPARIDFDYERGEVIREKVEYFLEMRASYTIEDLRDYLLSKENLYDTATLSTTRLIGALKWLVGTYGIELVLYMMDVSNDIIQTTNSSKLKSIMDIQNYYQDAKEIYDRKFNESRVSGNDKVVPKKRLLYC